MIPGSARRVTALPPVQRAAGWAGRVLRPEPPAPPPPVAVGPLERLEFALEDGVATLRMRVRPRRGWTLRAVVLRGRGVPRLLYRVGRPDASGLVLVRIDVAALVRDNALSTTTLKFYLQWIRRRSSRRARRDLARTGRRRRLSARLGGAEETIRPPHVQRVEVDGVEVLLECTMAGNLSVRIDDEPVVRPRGKTTAISTSADQVEFLAEVKTYNRGIAAAGLVVLGRQSQSRVELPAQVDVIADRARAQWGHLTFALAATLDLAVLAQQIPPVDDIVDVAFEVTIEGRADPLRVGLTLPAGLEEHRLRSTVAPVAGEVCLCIPYLTYRSHRLAYRLERWPADSYAYLQRLLRVAWVLPLVKPFTRIWLVGEVPYKAQDNGYHFFRYLRQRSPRRRAYYVMDRSSPDWDRVASLGNVIGRFSREHVRYSLLASRLVGSHHAEYLFASRDRRVARHIRGVRVFLQHGITASKNVTPIYARQRTLEKPTERFVVASEREQRIVVEDYGYAAHQVPITGFARFDALFAPRPPPARRVLVMPTWRELLRTDTFLESNYYRNWHGFLSHPGVQHLLGVADLEVTFLLHPNMRMFADHFDLPHVRLVRQGEVDVQDLLLDSAVLITDYSSVAWDFGFLRRPVLYFHFDTERLIGSQAPHVDPHTDYPGPIAATPESLLSLLRQVVADDLTMASQYWDRASAFLAHPDTQNCARIEQMVRRAWTVQTVADRLRNAEAVQRHWWRFRYGPQYHPWMRRLFWVGSRLPRRASAVFECDRGAHYGDSPRYLYERLIAREHGLRVFWVNNTTLRLDDPHTRKIARYSPTYYWQLSRARYWVNNVNFAPELAKPAGTRFLQTWHGTPLKRMQHDVPNMLSREEGYQERAARLTSYWDLLLSASPYATRCFRSAFRFGGSIAELGYPRNDLFFWPDADERARLIRARLGLADDPRQIILYAPTFRDDARTGVHWTQLLELDVQRLAAEFGDTHVLVIRFHQLVRASLADVQLSRPDFLRDASKYPDIGELLLVSDVLITDYSSVFFDYAALRRPILFYTYDLENYRDRLRGFYLDFEAEAPGPLLRTNDEVAAALRSLDEVRARYAGVLESFATTYAPRDDGGASDRVLDAFLGPAAGRRVADPVPWAESPTTENPDAAEPDAAELDAAPLDVSRGWPAAVPAGVGPDQTSNPR